MACAKVISLAITPAKDTGKDMVNVAVDQKDSRETAQQPGAEKRNLVFSTLVALVFPETWYWEIGRESPTRSQHLPRAARLRTGKLPCHPSIAPTPPLLKGDGRDVLLPLLLLFGASSQEAGAIHSSWPSSGTASLTALKTHHGPRGRFATQQRRRRRRPQRLATASLTTAATA